MTKLTTLRLTFRAPPKWAVRLGFALAQLVGARAGVWVAMRFARFEVDRG